MELNSAVKTGKSWQPVNKKYRLVSLIEYSFFGLIIWGALVICSLYVKADISPSISMLSIFLSKYFPIAWGAWLIYHWFADSKKSYFVSTSEVSFITGWFAPCVATVPFKRVQHIELKQGLMDRLFSLHKVVVLSAGKGLVIPGISGSEANALRAEILDGIDQE